MPRYAVLRDVTDPEIRPIGLVVEQPDMVRLVLARDWGIRTEFDEPYTVHEPDGAEVVYRPGEKDYFDHVVLSLSRTFVIEDVVTVEALDDVDVARIYLSAVLMQEPTRHPYRRGLTETEALAGVYTSARATAATAAGNGMTWAARHELGRAA
jgi:hypothetical protein